MNLIERPIYCFADIEFDPARNCLRRGGQEHALRQKSLQVLLYLIEHRERSAPKDELLENVWEGTAVTDDALVQIIVELRKLLGDDPRHPRFIRTVPKVGYQFVAPVSELHPELTSGELLVEVEEITTVQVEIEQAAAAPPQKLLTAGRGWLHRVAASPRRGLCRVEFDRRAGGRLVRAAARERTRRRQRDAAARAGQKTGGRDVL